MSCRYICIQQRLKKKKNVLVSLLLAGFLPRSPTPSSPASLATRFAGSSRLDAGEAGLDCNAIPVPV